MGDKRRTVCIPFTSVNLRSERYSASRLERGTVATLGQKGSLPVKSGSSTTMEPATRGPWAHGAALWESAQAQMEGSWRRAGADRQRGYGAARAQTERAIELVGPPPRHAPRHGSAETSIPSVVIVLPVQTRSTMQSTTKTRPARRSLRRATASWSFSQQKRVGCFSRSTRGRVSNSGASALSCEAGSSAREGWSGAGWGGRGSLGAREGTTCVEGEGLGGG